MATLLRSGTSPRVGVGDLLRDWRRRRHQSQLALALEAGVSQRHLSFVESGRAQASREMLLRLAESLDMPLREQNRLLNAAGFTAVYRERSLDDPALDVARHAVERVLAAHEPYPALAVDRRWMLVTANRSVAPLLASASPELLMPPVNVLRLSLHPEGLARSIVNYGQWRSYLLQRLARECELTGDAHLQQMLEELRGYPVPPPPAVARPAIPQSDARVFIPLQLATPAGVLSFISTTTVFGTSVDVTVAELSLECMYPADAVTAAALRDLVPSDG